MKDQVINLIESKIREVQKYTHLSETFLAREMILKDLLKEVKQLK